MHYEPEQDRIRCPAGKYLDPIPANGVRERRPCRDQLGKVGFDGAGIDQNCPGFYSARGRISVFNGDFYGSSIPGIPKAGTALAPELFASLCLDPLSRHPS
jgi:hypothetical protein